MISGNRVHICLTYHDLTSGRRTSILDDQTQSLCIGQVTCTFT